MDVLYGMHHSSVVSVDLDPDSRPFMWSDHAGRRRFLSDEQVQRFDRGGFCFLDGALSPSSVKAVAGEVDRVEEARDAWLEGQPDQRSWISKAGVIDFAPKLVRASARLRAFSASSPLTDICLDLIGPDVRVYFDQAVYKRPTAVGTDLPWHQDNGYNFKRPEAYLTIWIPLDDVDEDNGCLWVIPGAHRQGTGRHRRDEAGFLVCQVDATRAVPLPAKAGDIVVLSSLAPHATGANRSNRIRRAYLISYVADRTCLRDGTGCADPDTQYLVLHRGAIAGSSKANAPEANQG